MASALDLLLGSGPGQRAVVLGAVTTYLHLFVTRPTDAIEAIKNGVKLFARMFTLILAALLFASAIGALIPAETVQQLLGDTAGVGGAIVAGVVGGGLPSGPYSGSEAKAHPFTGVDEADNLESIHARSHGWIFHAEMPTFM